MFAKGLEKELEEVLIQNFHKNVFFSKTFIWEGNGDKVYIRFDLPVIRVEGPSRLLPKILRQLLNFALSDKRWILCFLNTDTEEKNIIGTDVGTKRIAEYLSGLEHLNKRFELPKSSPFASVLKFDLENPSIIVMADNEKYHVIASIEDLKTFNEKHNELLNEMEAFKSKILNVAKIYDESSYFHEEHGSLMLFGQHFPLLMKSSRKGWKVWFYKRFSPNCLITTPNLAVVENKILELTDDFASEERYFDLFR